MLPLNENKVTINNFIPIKLIFILLIPNYLSFSCVFIFIFALFRPPDPDPGDQLNADPCGSGSETLLI
jgi:hypothetical protein